MTFLQLLQQLELFIKQLGPVIKQLGTPLIKQLGLVTHSCTISSSSGARALAIVPSAVPGPIGQAASAPSAVPASGKQAFFHHLQHYQDIAIGSLDAFFFSKIDSRKGYFRIFMHPDDIPKAPFGFFKFLLFLFGLHLWPLPDRIAANLHSTSCLHYTSSLYSTTCLHRAALPSPAGPFPGCQAAILPQPFLFLSSRRTLFSRPFLLGRRPL